MSSDVKTPRLSPRECQEKGYLQEANRIFFHPLGLALCVTFENIEDLTEEGIYEILDCRDDPEGFAFDVDDIRANGADYHQKLMYVHMERDKRVWNREKSKDFTVYKDAYELRGIQNIVLGIEDIT